MGGWYDIFQGGTVRNYVGLKARVPGQRLMIGPRYHGPFNGKTGELDFGAAAKGDTDAEILRWYDHLLRGMGNGVEREKPVTIFVMGKNVWRNEDDWPLAARKQRAIICILPAAPTLWAAMARSAPRPPRARG